MNQVQSPNVLLALDESVLCAAAAGEMVAFAASRRATVHLLHCLDERSDLAVPRASRFLQAAARGFRRAGVEVHVRLVDAGEGGPGRQIAVAADEVRADLVALASRGVGDFQAILHGSVSHEVLGRCDRPVLLLRGAPAEFVPRRILAATDGGDGGRLAAALSLVALPESEVLVLHVPEIAVAAEVPWAEPGEAALATAEGAAAVLRRAGFRTSSEVRWGPVAYTIAETAAAEGADLVVLGSRPPPDLAALLVGSVAQQVIRRSAQPVLLPSRAPSKRSEPARFPDALLAGRAAVSKVTAGGDAA